MPCKCSGVRYEKCKCGYLSNSYLVKRYSDGTFVFLPQDSACYMHHGSANLMPPKQCLLTKLIENLYDKCAGYNMRYCPLRGYVSTKYLTHTIRDVVILLCFVLANLVVFLTILSRTIVHVCYVIVGSIRWIRKSLDSKLNMDTDNTDTLGTGT